MDRIIDIFIIILGMMIGLYLANNWKKQKKIEWSKNTEIYIALSVGILLLWLLYLRFNNKKNDNCIKLIIIFLTINITFHFCLFFQKYRKT